MAVALPRRFLTVIPPILILLGVVFFLHRSETAWDTIKTGPKNWKIPFTTDTGVVTPSVQEEFDAGVDAQVGLNEKLRIAIVEIGGTHDEVSSALIHAFGNQKNAEVQRYFANQRYHITDIVDRFKLASSMPPVRNHRDLNRAVKEEPLPHIVVSTTCELDLPVLHGAFKILLEKDETFLFCVMHHADRWKGGDHVKIVRQWVEAGKVDFIGLSGHTAQFLTEQTFNNWGYDTNISTRVLPPVFPVRVPDVDATHGRSLAMQGDYSSGRRDYKGIFSQLGRIIEKGKVTAAEKKAISLHVIGHGTPPEVPEDIREQVVFDKDLAYPDFYSVISSSFALLPAFASDTYFDRKASSSVPAALIAGAPLVVTQRLLDTYTYLPADASWVAFEGESEMDVIERVIGDTEEYERKRELMRATCRQLMKDNAVQVKEWIAEGLGAINLPVKQG